MRRRVARWLEANEMPADTWDDTLLVVSELLTNAIEASPSPDARVRLQLSRSPIGCRITVADQGPGFARAPRGRQPDGGRGLLIVRRLARELTTKREPDGWTVVSAVVPGSDKVMDAIRPQESAPSGR
jgi:anti-sigma regulatory factor (Ser/Thr protein kinase)